jgi:aminoglycoside phosphotransferase (APT) family kinase protein
MSAADLSPFDIASWSNTAFVAQQLGLADDATVETTPWADAGGMSAETHSIAVTAAAGAVTKYVLKTTKPGAESEAKASGMGLPREALFLRYLTASTDAVWADVKAVVPVIAFADGSMSSGKKAIVMERVDGAQAGYFFGPASPLNWGKDLAAETAGVAATEADVVQAAARIAAELHAPWFGRTEALLAVHDDVATWLRGSAWLNGGGEEGWAGLMQFAEGSWSGARAKALDGTDGVTWPAGLTAMLDASFTRATWADFQRDVAEGTARRRLTTLVHGDFHPANMMVKRSDSSIVLLDWEQVGVGSGPQELGQFLISHSTPESRRALCKAAVAEYTAVANKVRGEAAEALAEADVLAEYVQGGVGRWMWLLPVLCSMCPPAMVQYFVDQVAAFAADHGITADNIPMPRV